VPTLYNTKRPDSLSRRCRRSTVSTIIFLDHSDLEIKSTYGISTEQTYANSSLLLYRCSYIGLDLLAIGVKPSQDVFQEALIVSEKMISTIVDFEL